LKSEFLQFRKQVEDDTKKRTRSSPPGSPQKEVDGCRKTNPERGRPASAEIVERGRADSVGAESKVIEDLLKKCSRAGRNPAEIWEKALKEFRVVEVEDWLMPAGYRERLAPEICSKVYATRRTMVEHAQAFLRDHGLEECLVARNGMLDAGEAIDKAILEDQVPNVVNTTLFETLCRQYYATEMGFSQCRAKSDWLKPGGAKAWKTKVDFDTMALLSPKAKGQENELLRSAETEVKAEMQRRALMSKARQESGQQAKDTINDKAL